LTNINNAYDNHDDAEEDDDDDGDDEDECIQNEGDLNLPLRIDGIAIT